MAYYPFHDDDGNEYGSFEVWWKEHGDDDGEFGWYWWACFPGCLPESNPEGPYTNESDAIEAAQGM